MKRMGSDSDKSRQGLWNETERYFENHMQGLKSLKRQKNPTKSFVWADELKRQFTYTLKPSKCSNTDLPEVRYKTGNGDGSEVRSRQEAHLGLDKLRQQQNKFFSDVNIEKIFVNSEYFKMKMNGSMSFCSGENGENRWTIETSAAARKTSPPSNRSSRHHSRFGIVENNFLLNDSFDAAEKTKEPTLIASEDTPKVRKPTVSKKTESVSQAEELKILRDNVDAVIQEMKLLNRDFGLVRMDLKTIEKLLMLQKQVTAKSRPNRKEGLNSEIEDINLKLGKFSEEVEKAAQELRDFIDNNRTLLVENEDVTESPDFDKIINHLHRLSETAYQPKIIQTTKGAKFEMPREIPISLYADGMLLRNAEFRKYTDIRAGLFLRDIEDGFFPSELWPEYPCGVPFQVTDRRYETFNEGNTEFLNSFPGNGRRLGSLFDGKPASMVYLPPTKYLEMMGDVKSEKKRQTSFSTQEHYKHALRSQSTSHHSHITEERTGEAVEDVTDSKPLSLKVRLGMGKETHINISIMSDEKMTHFQDALFKKLCEKYHDEYVKDVDFNCDDSRYGETVPDFEVHIYGRKPFRLSENLSSSPSECGILDNCVINITEI